MNKKNMPAKGWSASGGTNFYYPLPKKKLIERYKPLFDVIKKRQSGCFIGLPKSAKSGYLQFLLEEKKIIKSLLPGFQSIHKVLYFEPIPVITDNPYHWLFQLSIKLEILDVRYQHRETEDPIVILTNIQKYLIELSKKKEHLTLILSRPDLWEKLTKEAGYALKALWDTKRQPPQNVCSLIFLLHSKNPATEALTEFYIQLKIAMDENHLFFPALDKVECTYTVNRFAEFLAVKNASAHAELIYELTGGFYPLITNLLKLLKSQRIGPGIIRTLVSNKTVTEMIEVFWNSLDDSQKVELQKAAKGTLRKNSTPSTLQQLGIISYTGTIVSTWIRSFVLERKFNKQPSVAPKLFLKGKEYVVFQLLDRSKGELITRDQVAEILWNHETREKYSDWAIDKTISRIRQKLTTNHTACSIITIKKQGYVLLS